MFYLAVVQGHAWYPERSQPAGRDPDLPRSKGEFIHRAGWWAEEKSPAPLWYELFLTTEKEWVN